MIQFLYPLEESREVSLQRLKSCVELLQDPHHLEVPLQVGLGPLEVLEGVQVPAGVRPAAQIGLESMALLDPLLLLSF